MSKEIIPKVWITKYALSEGVFVLHNVELFDMKMIVDINSPWRASYHGKDWHRTRSDAVARVDEMKQKKIASYNKSIRAICKIDPMKDVPQ